MEQARATKTYPALLLAAALVIAADQITKEMALDALGGGRTIDVIDGVVRLRLAFNSGGAFGILQDLPGFFLAATALVVGAILIWARRIEQKTWTIPLGLVLGGGVGNLIDRIWRDFDGRVVDFIDLQVWPVFNLADSAIVVGVGTILVLSFRSREHSTQE